MNIYKTIINYIFLFFSILILLYTTYKSEFIWDGTRREYYLAYYLFSILLIFVSIIFLFLSENLKKIIFIFFNTIIISVFSIEIYLIYKQNNYKPQQS